MQNTRVPSQRDALLLRYSQQTVLKAMDAIRGRMRGSNRLLMREAVEDPEVEKSPLNPTKAIDREAEDLMIDSLVGKFRKIPGLGSFTVFSEEAGIKAFPPGADASQSRWIAFIDPIDGTEFAESLQGGWSLLGIFDRRRRQVAAVVAGDIFLNRLYWASRGGDAEAIDFVTHSWFRLDGGPKPKADLSGARINVLTTKVSRFLALAGKKALLEAIERHDGRINLAWGSNLLIQVAAGYADAGIEFAKGFATYDILPGLYIAEKAGLTILDLDGRPIHSRLDIDRIFQSYRTDPKRPARTPFVAAKNRSLAEQIVRLLDETV